MCIKISERDGRTDRQIDGDTETSTIFGLKAIRTSVYVCLGITHFLVIFYSQIILLL